MADGFDLYNRDDDVVDTAEIQSVVQEILRCPLRIAVPVFEPYTYPCVLHMSVINTTICPNPGIAAEILHYALRSANISYTLIPVNHLESWGTIIGRDPDTNVAVFDGLLGNVVNGTYDTVMTSWGMTDVRMYAMDYTNLVEQLAKQTHRTPFISMTELATYMKLGQYQLITYDLSDFYFTQVAFGEGTSFSAMRDAIEQVPPIVEPLGLDKVIERLLHDPGLVLPGVAEITAPNLMKNRCELMFIRDLDMSSIWGSFLFRRRSVHGMAVSQAMATMIDFMVFIGEKYYAYQSLGDDCVRTADGHETGSKAMRVRCS
uniref:Uncharacterized protein n=1 Tax=Plectus sambesii TaxID=2011161 RepID=A0A914WQC3_9BILA